MTELVATLNATLQACGLNLAQTPGYTGVPISCDVVNAGASTSQAAPLDSDPEYEPSDETRNKDTRDSDSESDVDGGEITLSSPQSKRGTSSSSEDFDIEPRRKRHRSTRRKYRKKSKKRRRRERSSSSESGNTSSSSSDSSTDSDDDMPQGNFNTSRVRLDLRVPAKLKRKIWADKYVELSDLLLAARKPGALFERNKKGKGTKDRVTINSIVEWVTAFNVYIAVYTMKFPEQAPNIMHYVHTVMELARVGGDWRSYDHEFRVARVNHPCPWHELNGDLYVTYRYQKLQVTRPTGNTNINMNKSKNVPPRRRFPEGTCWRFHNGKQCNQETCQYTHTCYVCSGPHPVYQCARQGQGNQRNQTNSFTPTPQSNAYRRPGSSSTTQGANQSNANARTPQRP